MHGADGRTRGWPLTRWSGGRADGRRSRKAADGWADGGGKVADSRADGRTGPTRHKHTVGRKRRGQGPRGADKAQHARTGGQAVGRMGGLSGQGWKSHDRADEESAGRADGRTGTDGHTGSLPVGQTGGRADERVGLGLKGHIPRGWIHSWAPSPLASSERECAGCLGVQWNPVQSHVKHPYLAPRLTCLV